MKANVWASRLMALVALGVLVATLIGLEHIPSDSMLGQILRRLTFWTIGTTCLWGSCALVLWPRQLVARSPVGIGIRGPSVCRAFGCFGMFLGFFFLVGAGHGKSNFEGYFFIAGLVCSGVVIWWGLNSVKKTMNRGEATSGSLWAS